MLIRLWRRLAALLLLLLLPMAALPLRADELWDMHEAAGKLEQAGNIDAALPLWERLAAAYAERGNATNAALFHKKLGAAYDSRGLRRQAVLAYEAEARYWEAAGHGDWGKVDLLRADQLRGDVRLFVERPAHPPARPLARHEPPVGALLGAYTEKDPAIVHNFAAAGRVYGKPLAAFLIYWDYHRTYGPDPFVQAARAAGGAALQIALQPVRGLDEVQDNAHLRDLAETYRQAGIPIFLRFASEMNGDWTQWTVDAQTYIRKFRLVARAMHSLAPNVAMVWSPSELPEGNIESYYPGDDVVDWVGISMYNDYYNSGRKDSPGELDHPLDKLRFLNAKYGGRKPIMISEWAVANREYTEGRELDQWAIARLQELYAGLPRIYPAVKAVYYWSVDQKQTPNPYHPVPWSSYLLTEKQAVLAAFQEAIKDPYYLSGMNGSAPHSYDEVTDRLEPRREVLSSFVNLFDPVVSRVEYLLNGVSIGSSTIPPYAVAHDFGPYRGRKVGIAVRAYDSQGRLEQELVRQVQVGDPVPQLKDMAGHWAAAQVSDLVARGAVSGYPDGTFRPDENMSREAFYAMSARALGLLSSRGATTFVDVAEGRWSQPYVRALLDAGILVAADYPGARLGPEAPITRAEMGALIARAGRLEAGDTAGFSDAGSIPTRWRGLVGAAAERGLIRGFPGGRFGPDETTTRAQAATVITRLLELNG